jgi:hypothetical protein
LMEACLFLFSSSGMTTPNAPDSYSNFEKDNRKGAWWRQEANCQTPGK